MEAINIGNDMTATNYTLISPKQLYTRINRELDEPIGLTTIYKLVKESNRQLIGV